MGRSATVAGTIRRGWANRRVIRRCANVVLKRWKKSRQVSGCLECRRHGIFISSDGPLSLEPIYGREKHFAPTELAPYYSSWAINIPPLRGLVSNAVLLV